MIEHIKNVLPYLYFPAATLCAYRIGISTIKDRLDLPKLLNGYFDGDKFFYNYPGGVFCHGYGTLGQLDGNKWLECDIKAPPNSVALIKINFINFSSSISPQDCKVFIKGEDAPIDISETKNVLLDNEGVMRFKIIFNFIPNDNATIEVKVLGFFFKGLKNYGF